MIVVVIIIIIIIIIIINIIIINIIIINIIILLLLLLLLLLLRLSKASSFYGNRVKTEIGSQGRWVVTDFVLFLRNLNQSLQASAIYFIP